MGGWVKTRAQVEAGTNEAGSPGRDSYRYQEGEVEAGGTGVTQELGVLRARLG